MSTFPRDIEELSAVVDQACAPHREIVSVYLFGSHAWGTPHRESDLDIAVLLRADAARDSGSSHELEDRLRAELASALHEDQLDLAVLNQTPPLLARRIVLDGTRVVCRDQEADREFRRDVMLRAADLAPFLARMARIKLEAIRR